MTEKTKELLERILTLQSHGRSIRYIAKDCSVTPQYIHILIRNHKRMKSIKQDQCYGLSTRVINCLKERGIPINLYTIADKVHLILTAKGIGDAALAEIGKCLKTNGVIHSIDEWIEEGKRRQYH